MKTDRFAARANFTASQSPNPTTASKLDKLRADNRRLPSQVLDLTATADSLRVQFSNLQSSNSLTALSFLRGEQDRYLGLLQPLAGQIDRLNSLFTTLAIRSEDSRFSFCRGVETLLQTFQSSFG